MRSIIRIMVIRKRSFLDTRWRDDEMRDYELKDVFCSDLEAKTIGEHGCSMKTWMYGSVADC